MLIIYFIINLFFLIINIYIYLNIGLLNENYIKNIDQFIIKLAKKSFKNISFSFNKKFIISNYETKWKKKISLYTVGSSNKYWENIFRNNIIEGLKDNFIFEFNSENPDYLIYDIFNCDFLNSKYDNAIKIAYFTENQIPDFNKADYAIGFDNLMYLDRYFRKTTLIWVFENKYLHIKNKEFILQRQKSLLKKKKFCAAVISNYHFSNRFRIKFIK